jgi:hypothetical protein
MLFNQFNIFIMESIFATFFDRLKVSSPTAYTIMAAVLIGLNASLTSGFILIPDSTMKIISLVVSSAVLAIMNPRTKRHMSEGVLAKGSKDYND